MPARFQSAETNATVHDFQNNQSVVSLNSEGEIVLERDGEKQIEEVPAAPAV